MSNFDEQVFQRAKPVHSNVHPHGALRLTSSIRGGS